MLNMKSEEIVKKLFNELWKEVREKHCVFMDYKGDRILKTLQFDFSIPIDTETHQELGEYRFHIHIDMHKDEYLQQKQNYVEISNESRTCFIRIMSCFNCNDPYETVFRYSLSLAHVEKNLERLCEWIVLYFYDIRRMVMESIDGGVEKQKHDYKRLCILIEEQNKDKQLKEQWIKQYLNLGEND